MERNRRFINPLLGLLVDLVRPLCQIGEAEEKIMRWLDEGDKLPWDDDQGKRHWVTANLDRLYFDGQPENDQNRGFIKAALWDAVERMSRRKP